MPLVVDKPRKTQIEETAEDMFRERGYSATSMRMLANELGIEPASLYSHIKSKEDILANICFRMADEFFEKVAPIGKLNCSTSEKLSQLVMAHMQVVISNLSASAVFFHDWKFMTEPNLSEFKSLRKAYETQFKQVLVQGMKQGEFAINDVHFVTQTIFSSMNMTHEWYRPDGNLPGTDVGKQLAYILLKGISTTT